MIAPAPTENSVSAREISDFADENDLGSCIGAILAATGECFPGCAAALRLERDAEIDTDRYIVIEVDVSGWSTDEMFTARNRWSDEFGRASPSEKSHLFQIRLVQRP
jgi:hypothetical protein